MCKYDVSVIVLTYHPAKQKLLQTLASIIMQKDIKFQIVVSDDGSPVDYFEEIKSWFDKMGFENYKLVKNLQNVGTVKNIRLGLSHSDGDFVKLISPGDFLAYENALSQWVKTLRDSNKKWSFSNAVYYNSTNESEFNPIIRIAHPQIMSCYNKKNDARCRINYLYNNDICLGAATLCDRLVMTKYLDIICDKVIYAEDNAYRIMVHDNIIPVFFDRNIICYEYGNGVSTQKSDKWNKLLKEDWEQTSKIILDSGTDVKNYQVFSKLVYKIKKKFFKRNTTLEYDKDFVNRIFDMKW